MRYRIDELAAKSGFSVDTVRYYQAQGLLHRPQREGRAAWYGDDHLKRLERIRAGKDRGLPLATIRRLLPEVGEGSQPPGSAPVADGLPADAALAAELAGPLPGGDGAPDDDTLLTLEELGTRTDLPLALLEALEREGLLVARTTDGDARYTPGDASVLRSALSLLEAGIPLDEFLDLARRHDAAMREVTEHAVELFIRFVRDPISGSAASEQEASERLVTAFREMLPATSAIVGHHFRRLLLNAAQARIERDGDEQELAALRRMRATGAVPARSGNAPGGQEQ